MLTIRRNLVIIFVIYSAHFDLETGKYYAWFDDGGSDGVNCLIGQKFLENYYSVYDTTKKRIGFASHKSKSW